MSASELAGKQCVPCRGGVPPLAGDQIAGLLDAAEVVIRQRVDPSLAAPDEPLPRQVVSLATPFDECRDISCHLPCVDPVVCHRLPSVVEERRTPGKVRLE